MDGQTYRHGDVNFIACELPEGATEVESTDHFVAQEGETTGHKHRVKAPDRFRVYEHQGIRYYQAVSGLNITHEDHHKLSFVIPAEFSRPAYKQRQEREKDWFSLSVRQVID